MVMFVMVLLLWKILPRWVLETILWISFLSSSPWLRKDALIVGDKLLNFFSDTLVSNISGFMVVVMLLLWKILPRWILESILWISLLCSSPWLWEYTLIVSYKLLNFFSNTLVSNVSCFMMLMMSMLISLLSNILLFSLSIECSSSSTKTNWLWECWIIWVQIV